jgi:phosphoribosylanthranilate isomerase
VKIKICGITTAADADACAALGADMIGLNFVPSSPRRVDVAAARAIADAVRGRVEIVGVVADLPERALLDLRAAAGLDRLQLHGDEPPDLVRRLGGLAFKAVRVGSAADVEAAGAYEGLLLVDAKVPGALGGTGRAVDPGLVAPLCRARQVLLAGGLGPGNVAAAVRALHPWGVDVASGVERAPGVKDPAKVAAFVQAARALIAGRPATD